MTEKLNREPFVNVPNGWAVSLNPNGWVWTCPNCNQTNTIYTYTRTVVCEKCGADFIGLLDYYEDDEE